VSLLKKKIKWVAFIVAAVLATAAGIAAALRPVTVEATVVHPATVTLTFTEQGSYGYNHFYSVYPLVAGEVLEVRVEEGDPVAAGDVIAVVSASDYEYQITQLQSAVEGYKGQISNLSLQEEQEKVNLAANLESLQGQLTTLEAQMEQNWSGAESLELQISIQEQIVYYNQENVHHARLDLDDAREYGDDDEVDQARQAYNTARSALSQSRLLLEQLKAGEVPEDIHEGQRQSIQAQMDAASTLLETSYTGGMVQYYNAQIAAAQANIAQMREKAGQAELTAPVGGVLSELPVKNLNILSQQTLSAVIGDDEQVEVFVPIREIDGVAVGDKVELLLDKRLGTETIAGTVIEVDDEAQVKLSALGVEERKVRVQIRPEQPGLRIGYDMDVRFTVYTRENALTVPKTAVFSQENNDYVWIIQEGAVQLRQIVKGVETRDGYIIEAGLQDGSVVVTDADNGTISQGKRVEYIVNQL